MDFCLKSCRAYSWSYLAFCTSKCLTFYVLCSIYVSHNEGHNWNVLKRHIKCLSCTSSRGRCIRICKNNVFFFSGDKTQLKPNTSMLGHMFNYLSKSFSKRKCSKWLVSSSSLPKKVSNCNILNSVWDCLNINQWGIFPLKLLMFISKPCRHHWSPFLLFCHKNTCMLKNSYCCFYRRQKKTLQN